MKNIKIVVIFIIVCFSAVGLLWLNKNPIISLQLFDDIHLNAALNYQITSLFLAFSVIALSLLLSGTKYIRYLKVNKIDGPVGVEPWLGITSKNKDTWRKLGANFALIISIVTAIVIYLQVYQGNTFRFILMPNLLMVFVFALSNSFVEESIFRFSFASVIESTGQSRYISQGLSALTFGVVHYFGTPSGIPGVLMAAFIGWFLSKSIHETKGFFWAWFIHFLQDVIIMFGFYMIAL